MKKSPIALSLLLSACVFGSLQFKSAPFLTNADFTFSEDLKEEYFVGEELNVPLCSLNGTTASSVVTFPDGSVTNSKNLRLTMAGNYKVVFRANGETDIKEFVVYNKLYSSSSGESIEYKEHSFTTSNDTSENTAGLMAELKDGSTFTFNKPINISNYEKDDVILSLNVVANNDGVADFKILGARLTDIYDPTNYVDVLCEFNSDDKTDLSLDSTKYMRAGASNQNPSGYASLQNKLHVGSYGSWVSCSFMNKATDGNNLTETFDVRMDYKNKIIYGPRKVNWDEYICDLDSIDEFGEDTWNGFTTGECYVSVYAKTFFNSNAHVFIRQIGEYQNEDFIENKIMVTEGPSINVDFKNYDPNALPKAIVGKPYKIFDASSRDSNCYCGEVKKTVNLELNDGSIINCSIKNNCFTPSLPGLYSINYISRNAFGVETNRKVYIEAILNDNPLDIQIGEHSSTFYTGEEITLPTFNYINEQGEVEKQVFVSYGDTTETIDANVLKYKPIKSGSYKFIYKATDYAGQVCTKEFEISVNDSNLPIFDGEANIRRYLIAGYENEIPMLNAIDYKDNGNTLESKIYVKEGANPRKEIVGNLYTPTIGDDDYEVTIIYEAVGKYATSTKEYTTNVRQILLNQRKGRFDNKNLFVTNDHVTSKYTEFRSGEFYSTYSFSDDSYIEYANAIPVTSFELKMNVLQSGFEKLNLVFEDVDNSENVKNILFERRQESGTLVSFNGGTKFTISDFNMDNPESNLSLSYENNKMIININNSFNFDLTDFESQLGYFKIECNGVTSDSDIMLKQICNQNLNNYNQDEFPPIVSLIGAYKSEYHYGETINSFKAVCVDLIKPTTKSSLTVYDPDLKVINGLENVDIHKSYPILLDKYGKYRFSYTVEDLLYTFDFVINVVDEEAPEITLLSNVNDEYKVGDSLNINAKAFDKLDGEVTVHICMQDTYGSSITVKNGESFLFTRAGQYRLRLFAYDSLFNYSCLNKDIIVK